MNPGWRKNYLRYRSFFLNIANQYRERADIKVYLEILLSLATITIFSVFALRPTLLTIAALLKEIETKKETLTQIDSKIQKLSQAQSINDQQRKNLLLLNSAVPDKAEPDVFVRQIEAILSKNSLTATRINLGEGVILADSNTRSASDKAQELTFSIQTRLDIKDYLLSQNVISDLENLRIPVKIGNISFSLEEDKETGTKYVTLIISGVIPYLFRNL